MKVLLEAGAQLMPDDEGWTPLHVAAASSSTDCRVIRLLVSEVVSSGDFSLLDAKTTQSRNTALHLAANNDNASSPAA